MSDLISMIVFTIVVTLFLVFISSIREVQILDKQKWECTIANPAPNGAECIRWEKKK